MFAALVGRSLRRHATLIMALGTLLSAFQLVLIFIAAGYQRDGLFAQMGSLIPQFVQEAFGAEIASFGGTVALGFFHPVVMIALSFGAIYIASEPAAEIEEGLVDLVVARPVPRSLIITRSAVVCGGATAAIVFMMIVANRLAVAWLVPPGVPAPRTGPMLLVALNLLAVLWCFGSAALVAAARTRRRAAAAGMIGFAAVFLYLLQFVGAAWAPARPYARVSPFHYYEAMRTLLGMHNPRPDFVVLLAATAALSATAYVLYARRDL
jgi:hypothetical protein